MEMRGLRHPARQHKANADAAEHDGSGNPHSSWETGIVFSWL